MTLITLLAAVSAIAAQTNTLTLAGKVVQVTYPESVVRQVPDAVKSWDGFIGLPQGDRTWPTPFWDQGDWGPVVQKLAALGPTPKDAPEWKTKVFVLTETDVLMRRGGIVHQVRNRLGQEQVDAVLRSLARTVGYARAATNGAVNLKLDVTVDSDPVVLGETEQTQWVFDYVVARVNQGSFEAEDKEYRGPYQSVIVVAPGINAHIATKLGNGIRPNVVWPYDSWRLDRRPSSFEESFVAAIGGQASEILGGLNIYSVSRGGGQGEYVPSLATDFPSDVLSRLQKAPALDFAAIKELYDAANATRNPEDNPLRFPVREAPISPNVQLAIATDDQRGSVLRYAERSPLRSGGFALPYTAIDVAKTPVLSFWVKSSSLDRLELRIEDKTSLATFPYSLPLAIAQDGKWQQVVLDLRHQQREGISELVIGPSHDVNRDQLGEIVFFFDDFQLLSSGTPNQPLLDPVPDETKRATAAKDLSASELAKDPSDLVKLNGLLQRATPYAANDEAALTEMSKWANVRIAGEAVRRLAQLGTSTAKAEILRLVTASPFEYVKQIAAVEVGKLGDPKPAGILSRLFASKSWQTRLAGAQAITMLPGDEAAVIAMTFLQETNPQVRWVVTQGANTKNAVVLKRLLWSAVNDPSDAVRAESCWKLINCGKAREVAEGYKGIRDDSIGVRLDLLARMAKNPAEGHRGSIRIAIVDPAWIVRVAALHALATQLGAVTIDEIANTLEDKIPAVQMALLDLTKAKSLSLPATSIASLKASIDPRVVDRAKELVP